MIVWIFQTGEPLHIDGSVRGMRAMNLSNALIAKGHSVVLWATDFNHQKKLHRFKENRVIEVSDNLQIRLLRSPGYKRNIGPGRLVDHWLLASNLKKHLKKELLAPDVAFVGYPPIEAAAVMVEWLNKKNIPTLLDVKDQWPDMFLDIFPPHLKIFGRILFYPYFNIAKKAMRDATGLSTMSDGFLEWAREFSGRECGNKDRVFPLTAETGGTSESEIDHAKRWWDEYGVRNSGCANFCFIGSISQAFDFLPIKHAAELAIQNQVDIKFVICGDGGRASEVKYLMRDLPNVIFPGWIDRPKIEVLAGRSIASIAPYISTKNFVMNIPNKILDSLSLSLPLLSSLQGEVKDLLEKNNVGIHYDPDNKYSLYECILKLLQGENARSKLSENAKKIYDEKFDFQCVYSSLVTHLETLASKDKHQNSKSLL